ncbi:MAG: AmmeMemoRadiSam system protein A [Patescibacteria group bacterium]
MKKKLDYCKLARQSIEYYLVNKKTLSSLQDVPSKLKTKQAGVFVSLHNNINHDLQGCIGTFKPVMSCVALEIIHNAVSAAFYDPRFLPLKQTELSNINISVDVLGELEQVMDIKKLNPKKYGIFMQTPDNRKSALLLPLLDGVDTVDQQLEITAQKGYINLQKEQIALYRFLVKRYTE